MRLGALSGKLPDVTEDGTKAWTTELVLALGQLELVTSLESRSAPGITCGYAGESGFELPIEAVKTLRRLPDRAFSGHARRLIGHDALI